ncbi:MAG: hypothetical protein N838_18845 [Thiohalocapsa sp. PB-PSB1]|nr:MAG: hypothetical protein N838_18845 [Thiohalocapsa sp. PB-PSB1]
MPKSLTEDGQHGRMIGKASERGLRSGLVFGLQSAT